MDSEKRGLRDLKANLGKKARWNLKQAYKGCGWPTVLTILQDVTYLYREDFRDTLQWQLDLTLQDTLLTCDGCSGTFTVGHEYH